MENNNNNNPLWLPKGSIRSIIALGIVSAAIVAVFKLIEVPQPLWDLALVVIGFYFGTKVGSEKPQS